MAGIHVFLPLLLYSPVAIEEVLLPVIRDFGNVSIAAELSSAYSCFLMHKPHSGFIYLESRPEICKGGFANPSRAVSSRDATNPAEMTSF
jgi:hypothetical protein